MQVCRWNLAKNSDLMSNETVMDDLGATVAECGRNFQEYVGFLRKERSLGSEERRERKRRGKEERREGGKEEEGRRGEKERDFNNHKKKTIFLFPISCSEKPTPLCMLDFSFCFFWELSH